MTYEEELWLSISPFTIPELFEKNLKTVMLPYLTEDRRFLAPKNSVFYNTEQIADKLYFLNRGIAVETLINENGLEKNFMIFPPYLLGLNYCAHEQPIFPCTSAYSDCEVYLFSYDELIELMQRDPCLLRPILKMLALDFRMANNGQMQVQSSSTHGKICQTVLTYAIAAKYNQEVSKLRMTQQLIAGLTGVHRVSVVRTLQNLKDENIITTSQKSLRVLDFERLKELAFGKYSI